MGVSFQDILVGFFLFFLVEFNHLKLLTVPVKTVSFSENDILLPKSGFFFFKVTRRFQGA